MIKKFQEFSSLQEVQKVCSLSYKYLYVYRNVVYDLTDFLQLHPGGKIPLQQYKGRDLENILFNASIHKHSSQVLKTMQKYKCGVIVEKTTNQSTTTTIQHKNSNQRQKQMPQVSPKTPSEPQSQLNRDKPVTSTQSKNNKEQAGQSEKLNQSFSKLNQSFTSSNPSQQFLQLPNKEQLQKQQKLKQQKLLQEWKQLGIGQTTNQQITSPNYIQSSNENDLNLNKSIKVENRKAQSEINSTQQVSFNPYYKQWLEKQKQQKQEQSLAPKKNNPYYEQWKNKQKQQQQTQQDYSIIMEENESFQIQSQSSFVNNSMQRSLSQISSKSIVQEIPNLIVPKIEVKLITNLNNKLKNKNN